MRYPELTDDQRQLLFDIVEASREAGPGPHEIVALIREWSVGREIRIAVYRAPGESPVSRDCQAGYVSLKVLEDVGYLRIDPRGEQEGAPEIVLTQLALDYFRWYHKPRAYKAFSSWWANLSGEERGVIIALLVTLVLSPLAGALFGLAQRLVESLLPK